MTTEQRDKLRKQVNRITNMELQKRELVNRNLREISKFILAISKYC